MTDISEPRTRALLPFLPTVRHGSRSHATCFFKCGNACDAAIPNQSDGPTFADVVATAFDRRSMLKAAGAGALLVVAGPTATAVASDRRGGGRPSGPGSRGALTFAPVAQNQLDKLVVPDGYRYSVVMRWGDPVERGAREFDIDRQSADAQAKQFGYNCDYVGLLPLDDRGNRFLLVVNHEYTNEELMFADYTSLPALSDEQKKIAMMAHGITVVEVERRGNTGDFRPARSGALNRRITAVTPMELTGPAAGSQYVRTTADPTGRRVLGTLNDCAGGMTPWGTTLHGEENVNQYFSASGAMPSDAGRRYSRYGITANTGGRRWDSVDKRFDLSQEPNEPNRFGWVVEVDPYDPGSTPRKRTALGRFKHEGANVQIAEDGRVVAYSGDDERFDYIYKFVSTKRFKRGYDRATRAHNLTLLDEGDLYVARFTGDSPAAEIDGSGGLPSDGEFEGTGRWIPLVKGGRSMVPNRDVAWVLTFTRLAADGLGAADPAKAPTRMDRPEDIQVNPVNGRVYAALTNNANRTGAVGAVGPDEANPLTRSWAYASGAYAPQAGNRNGYVIEWQEKGSATSEAFDWRIFLVCGDPAKPETYFAGFDKSEVSAISCPDNVVFDPAGNLWIATDGSALPGPTGTGTNDGMFAVPTAGQERGFVKAFLTVPIGAECCGPLVTPDAKSVWTAVQHPGEGGTRQAPRSTWPDRRSRDPFPRPSVAVVFRRDGGRVGT